MRYAAKKDLNHKEIVRFLVKIGADIWDMSRVGGGFPDLLVGFRGKLYAIEIKSENGKQQENQKVWQARWEAHGGIYLLVRSSEELGKHLGVTG